MKRLLYTLVILLMAAPAFSAHKTGENCGGFDLACGLVGYWRMEGSFRDFSGNRHHCTGVNGATTTTGKLGKAFQGDEANEHYLDCGNNNVVPSGAFTVALWAKKTAAPAGTVQTFMGFSSAANFPRMGYNVTNSKVEITMNGGGSLNYRFFNEGDINDGNWHCVIFTLPGSGQNDISDSGVYVDGTALTASSTIKSAGQASRDALFIGKVDSIGYPDYDMDEVTLWDRVLSARERAEFCRPGTNGTITPFQWVTYK